MCSRRQDSSIGFGAPVRANMATSGVTSGAVTSSLLESVNTLFPLCIYLSFLERDLSFEMPAAFSGGEC